MVAMVGGAMVSYPDLAPLVSERDAGKGVMLGYLLTLVAVAGWASATVFGKRLSTQGFSESQIMSGRFFFGFSALLVYCFANQTLPSSTIGFESFFKIVAMVLLSGFIGMFFYYRGLKQLSAHSASIAEMFFPASAVTINWIFLGKSLQPVQLAGAVILIGAAVGIHRKKETT